MACQAIRRGGVFIASNLHKHMNKRMTSLLSAWRGRATRMK
ncbi:hypothetical protein RR42_m2724 [Cupriavidus basilensis]|uniref:Uncharacterized protein n=1 Tax=Cupriavidus basilensis TaxID=68895 RepID=A0A0C4YDC9_9BURK|nr:hypothetical protein RR42_m2724 [Cupriavidus basilensis]